MAERIELPQKSGGGTEAQLESMYRYLYQMAVALNHNLAEIGGAALTDGEMKVMDRILREAGEGTQPGAARDAETLKSMIIKTAAFIKTAIDEYNMKLVGTVQAEGKLGRYVRKTGLDVAVNPEGIEQKFTFEEVIQGLKEYEINAKNYIKSGLLRTVGGIPVYGVAVGKDIVTFSEDGTETYHDGNKVAEYTADGISFYQNGVMIAKYTGNRISFYYGANEIFYIQAGKIYCANDLELASGKKLIINTENFKIDSTGKVTIKGDGEFSGNLSAAGGTFAGDLSAAGGTFSGNLQAAGGTFAGDLSAAGGTFSGNLQAAGGTFAGDLSAAGGTFGGTLSAADGTFKGNLQAAGGTFSGDLSAAGGTFSGNLQAAGGTFAGEVNAGEWHFDDTGVEYQDDTNGIFEIKDIDDENQDATVGIYYKLYETTVPSLIDKQGELIIKLLRRDSGSDFPLRLHFTRTGDRFYRTWNVMYAEQGLALGTFDHTLRDVHTSEIYGDNTNKMLTLYAYYDNEASMGPASAFMYFRVVNGELQLDLRNSTSSAPNTSIGTSAVNIGRIFTKQLNAERITGNTSTKHLALLAYGSDAPQVYYTESAGIDLKVDSNNVLTMLLLNGLTNGETQIGSSAKKINRIYADDVTYTTMTQSSSRDVKHDIADMQSPGERLDRLRPVTFVYNDDKEGRIRQGLILEETREIMPEICTETGINYMELVPMLLKEVQELRARVAALEEKAKGE